jgi:hypothetical protein
MATSGTTSNTKNITTGAIGSTANSFRCSIAMA